jgi:CDP-diacylglycerol---glycerol-3-phosphate 3-phosphatidyltransferase
LSTEQDSLKAVSAEFFLVRVFQTFVSGCVRGIVILGIRPNTLTLISLVLAAISGYAAAEGFFRIAGSMFLLSGLCDLLDGATARAIGGSTLFGALLDSTIDRVSDAAPLVGLVFFYSAHGWLAVIPCLVIPTVFTVSYIRARAESLGAKLPFLWMRRAERLLLITVALFFGQVGLPGVTIPAPIVLIGVSLVGLLSVGGALIAMKSAYTLMK